MCGCKLLVIVAVCNLSMFAAPCRPSLRCYAPLSTQQAEIQLAWIRSWCNSITNSRWLTCRSLLQSWLQYDPKSKPDTVMLLAVIQRYTVKVGGAVAVCNTHSDSIIHSNRLVALYYTDPTLAYTRSYIWIRAEQYCLLRIMLNA